MTRIAVVSTRTDATINWLRLTVLEGKPIKVNHERNFVECGDTAYHIINRKEQAYGFRFDGYLVAPDYESVLDVVRTRCDAGWVYKSDRT